MARKRGRPAKKPEPITRISVQATLDWAAWIDRAAGFCRTDVSKLVDAAVVDYLKARGFEEPPPPRT